MTLQPPRLKLAPAEIQTLGIVADSFHRGGSALTCGWRPPGGRHGAAATLAYGQVCPCPPGLRRAGHANMPVLFSQLGFDLWWSTGVERK